MKFPGCWMIMLLVALAATASFAKIDTTHKVYARTAQAKQMHLTKMLELQHPRKMAALKQKYAMVSKSCARNTHHAFTKKGAMYQKARQNATKSTHTCPYHR